ncbi:MAG: hypothetical protein ACRC6O_13030 [Flavobacterium sp.]
MYQLEIKEEVALDIKQAYEYYDEKKVGLGERFLDTLELYFQRIKQYPEHY